MNGNDHILLLCFQKERNGGMVTSQIAWVLCFFGPMVVDVIIKLQASLILKHFVFLFFVFLFFFGVEGTYAYQLT